MALVKLTAQKKRNIIDTMIVMDDGSNKRNGYTVKREYNLGIITELDALNQMYAIVGKAPSMPLHLSVNQFSKCMHDYFNL